METYADRLQIAARPVVPILNPGSEFSDQVRRFQGIPAIEQAPCGRLWATWYGGGEGEDEFNYVLLATSANQGERWSDPVLVIDPPGQVRAFDSVLWMDPNGKMWLFWTQSWTRWDGRAGVWAITTDHPEGPDPIWSEPRRLCDGVMLNKPITLATGEWILPVSFITPGTLKHPNWQGVEITPEEWNFIEERSGAWVVSSTDSGRTFQLRGGGKVPMEDRCHNEHMIIEREDGSLWMLIRTTYGIAESVSEDKGFTWSDPVRSTIPHTHSRFFIRRLQSGRLLLVKHDVPTDESRPSPKVRSHLTALSSKDDGRTWPESLVLEEGLCSYPDGIQSSDGTLFVTYDSERRGAKKILLARFREEDILAGSFVSPNARKRLLINQAFGATTTADDPMDDPMDDPTKI